MRWQVMLPRIATVLGLVCLATFEWGEAESLQTLAGACALWGPFAAVLFMWLGPAMPDRGERLALALAGSYAAAALSFFALSVFNGGWLFPWMQIAAVASLVTIAPWRRRVIAGFQGWRDWKCDWWLAALIVATLLISGRYRVAFDFSPTDGTRHFRLYHDQTYHTALAYELQRHVPPLQQATRAGTPDRAYHLFPHISTMLLDRYAGRGDLLRTQTTWSFVVATVLICLCLHYLVRIMAGSDGAGYVAVALLFILSIPFPPLIENPLGYFYFSIYPHATSLLEPVVMTTPQMYSGLVVFFGLMLGLAVCNRDSAPGAAPSGGGSSLEVSPSPEFWRIFALLGVMTGALLRFRAHIFLPFAPLFGLAGIWLAWRVRDWRPIAGVGLAVFISLALLFEMRQPIYQAGTAQFSLGYNNLTWPSTEDRPNPAFQWWWLSWPGAQAIFQFVSRMLPPAAAMWAWHVICTLGFVLFQVVGLPLAAAATIWFARPSSWKTWPLVTAVTLGLVGGSMLGAMVLNFQRDSYMLAGQMLLHICWYLFPMLPAVLWMACKAVSKRTAWESQQLANAGVGVLAVALLYQAVRGPSSLERVCDNMGFTLTANEWNALRFLREQTPAESVVVMPLRPQPGLAPESPEAQQRLLSEIQNFAICGGLAGRAPYIEYAHSPEEFARVRDVVGLWQSQDEAEFAVRLSQTKATHLLEYPGYSPRSFAVGVPSCLEAAWESGGGTGRVRVWKIKRAAPDEER